MDEKEKSWDFSFPANGDEEKYCIHKAGGTTPVKYRLEADILTLTADNNNNNNNNNKIEIIWDWHLKIFQPLTLCTILAILSFKVLAFLPFFFKSYSRKDKKQRIHPENNT